MQDNLLESYDLVPYRHGAIPVSHPARIGAIGRIHGLNCAPPDRCCVLELGCAEAMNLLPLAERFPYSEFVGVDISPVQIATGESAREACGLENARLVCTDLREFEPEPESFDYVIAHGVYSWVSDEVKERMLAICSRALSPEGLAYVSYNTLPGWSLLDGLRKVLREEIVREDQPEAQLRKAREVITALNRSIEGQSGAHAELLRQAFADMLAKPPELLFHDELAAINDPRTFTAFTNHAAAHGLQYVAEAHYATMPFEHVPESMRAPLEKLGPHFLQQQQFMDVVFQRWLRNSLLCGEKASPQRAADARVVRDCALGLRLHPVEARVNLAPGTAMRFADSNHQVMDFQVPAEKALLAVLSQAIPARIPFAHAIGAANRLLVQVNLPAIDNTAEICAFLLRLFTIDALDLVLSGNEGWLRTANSPAPSALMRYQARTGLPVINRWHEPVTVTGEGQQWLAGDDSSPPNEAAFRAGLLI
jgi:Methyltransferase domain/Predicted methyltransferase regulatory domain